MNLTRRELAKRLNEWADHFVAKSKSHYEVCLARSTEESIRKRIAIAVENDRKERDPDYDVGGWGRPSPEQQFEESIRRAEVEASEAKRVFDNNSAVRDYIRDITAKDL